MFHPIGLFKGVPCPRRHDCMLRHCVFDHELHSQPNAEAESKAYDPLSAGDIEPPASKRRRVELPSSEPKIPLPETDAIESFASSQRPTKALKVRHEAANVTTLSSAKNRSEKKQSHVIPKSKPNSEKRPVSPPPKQADKSEQSIPVERLIPRPVTQAPAVLKVRLALIELLYKQMSLLNSQVQNDSSSSRTLILTDQQIIKLVLDEEQQAAVKHGNDIYRNAMSQRVLQLKKTKIEEWKAFVGALLDSKQGKDDRDKRSEEASSGLTAGQEVQILKYLRTNLTGLDVHGYVTKQPNQKDIQIARDTIRTSGGYEVCDRCGTRFQVFPGRDEQGRLTTKGECHYHWAKLNRAQWQRTDHVTGQPQSSFACCGKPPGSEGCTTARTHVFKVTDPKRLAALWQFEQTPTKTTSKYRSPIAFDCEMAYTTHGMELVRVTAVSWPQNKEVLDVLVRPFGEILDLNTRFSGVSQEQFTGAPLYTETHGDRENGSEVGELAPHQLLKVDSPAFARQLMFDLLAPDTPLIGHAIDNDLNACRMIHSYVVDTVLLFPHPRGLPVRYGLKALTSKYLQRDIQTGGEAGHDSKEDSIATGDLVKVKVAEKWQMMRLQGWKFNSDDLSPPGR